MILVGFRPRSSRRADARSPADLRGAGAAVVQVRAAPAAGEERTLRGARAGPLRVRQQGYRIPIPAVGVFGE